MTYSQPTIIVEGKNLGKKNATNVYTQSMRDTYRQYLDYSHKRQIVNVDGEVNANANVTADADDIDDVDIVSDYVSNIQIDINTTIKMIPPMLLNKYARIVEDKGVYSIKIEKGNRKMDFNNIIYIQPKIDDLRCIATTVKTGELVDVYMYTRGLKIVSDFIHIRQELRRLLANHDNLYLDGGFYKHGMKLQNINSIVHNKRTTVDQSQLHFYIFDAFRDNDTRGFANRFLEIRTLVANMSPPLSFIHMIETERVKNHDDVIAKFVSYIKTGYEGAVIRYADGTYIPSVNNRRSSNTLKIKMRYDSEYEIVNFKCGIRGKDQGAIIWVLKTANGITFDSVPNDTQESRKSLYEKFVTDRTHFDNEYLGKMMTIEYDDISNTGVPARAKAIAIRQPE
jgi:ATP-dependent DNA ligase